ncbi:uncharacterized protein C8R40DRAFT_1168622 [Lentinula edodes]|uniref:uncharacterized protein n=1 Tax=Lentinula edodes TaxID=5353 RepID=UPI001E8CAE23|nr:uncharacterized protein C8R40DRAFT_1168622 [Lentinula edodes]KAH7877280.1 hypothetical protein C8R40DRAFT_1168622 [Lentinula edodes]
MFWSGNTRVLRVGSPSSPHDEFSSSTSNDKTLTKINDEYETYCQAVTPPAAYPSPPHTDVDAVCKIPLAPFMSGLYPHDDEEDYPDASHSKQNMRHAMSTSPIGGALDSPLIYLQHPAPLSPPPTFPAPTTLLPRPKKTTEIPLMLFYLRACWGLLRSIITHATLRSLSQRSRSIRMIICHGISVIGHSLGLYSLLLDQTGIPSPASPSFGMYEEYKCPWTPRSLDSSSNDDGTARYITKSMTTAPHLSYPSPKSSHWPHQIPLHPPSHPPFLSPDISTELPMQSEFPHPSSPSIRYIELHGPVYDSEAPGSQSPSIRTFELPELEEDEDLETGFHSALGLSLTSFPTMSEISLAPEDSSSRFSSLSQYILQNSPSLITCSPPISANFNDAGYDSATPSSMLLLDVNIESSQNIKFNPGRLPSPNTLVESLDSRSSHLPLDSSPSDIPSYADCPEYAVLRAQPDLYQCLLRLLALHRKAQISEKEAKIRERELVPLVELTDMCVVEAEKTEAKSTRQREKERRREVAAIVALTLFGGTHDDTKSSPSDGRVEVGSTLKSRQTSNYNNWEFVQGAKGEDQEEEEDNVHEYGTAHREDDFTQERSLPPANVVCSSHLSPAISMTVDSEEKVIEEDILPESDVKSDEENKGDNDKNDVDLGTGLKLKGFGDGLEWPMTVDTF